ncbi:zinc finger CCCH domain-containing protein 67 isoform X2 [Rhododendron vialii]|uniref:zinc finger CCCH domain-containing protein 67 isoform X2 n=1 Tax=Rhododendron vialii TaxID=182163 RepID=UPI00265DA2C7|nr:zinc finger CCCH domain-containing protein 67 isoform X2 [Rhododendron vialii]
MEESATSPVSHNDEQKPNSHQQQQQQQQQQPGFWRKLGFGFGFNPFPSVDPDPKPNPTPQPSDDQIASGAIAIQEPQTLQLTSEDIDDQVKSQVLEERGVVSNECVGREFDVDHELGTQQTLKSEELLYQEAVEEEIKNLVLEEKRNGNDEGNGCRDESNCYHREGIQDFSYKWDILELEYQQEVEEEIQNLVLEEKKNEYGDEAIGYYRNKNDYHYGGGDDNDDDDGKSEIEKEDGGNGLVEGETGGPMGWRKEGRYRRSLYPVRPDVEDCSHYVRTGACKFGPNCKFNHPFRRKNQFAKEKVKEREESPERPGQVECKYHLSPGGCKYGKACRYKHSIRKTPAVPIVEFNFLNLPIRPGERECPFYMRNGSCKYGVNCRFNHPDPTAVGGGDTLSGHGPGGAVPLHGASQSTMSPWSSPRALSETGPFAPVVFPPTQGIPSPYPERNGHQWLGNDHVYPAPSERRLPTPPAFSLNTPAEINFYAPHKQPMLIDEFPERPGQPECSYFLKTGNCKYKSGCKFHHPKNRLPKTAAPYSPALSDNGLPQRPGQNICSHYNRYGICKFGPACKFDHPVNYGHLAASSPGFVAPAMPSGFGNSPTVDDGWEPARAVPSGFGNSPTIDDGWE